MADAITTIITGFQQLANKLIELGPAIIQVLIVLIIAYFAIRIIKYFVKKLFLKVDFDEDIEHLITNAVGWVLWFLVLMWLVGQLGLQEVFESLLAIGALGGLAVALAVKDSLKDVVAGLMILKDRHFDLGDKVKAAGFEGKIIDVSLRKTRILLDNGRIAIVANSKIDSGGWELVERKGKPGKDFAYEDMEAYLAKKKAELEKIKRKVKTINKTKKKRHQKKGF